MGWSVTGEDWADADWTDIALYRQFWEALNERRIATGQSAVALPAVGADIQWGYPDQDNLNNPPTDPTGRFGLRYIQEWISYQTRWGNSNWIKAYSDYPNRTKIGLDAYTGGEDDYLWFHGERLYYQPPDRLFPFRAATSMPADWTAPNDPAYDYRFMLPYGHVSYPPPNGSTAIGDIFGPWLFVDLQNALNQLVRTRHNGVWTDKGGNTYATSDSGFCDTPAAAKAACQADWSHLARLPNGGVGAALYLEDNCGPYHSKYRAMASRGYGYGQIASLSNHVKRAIAWYAYTEAVDSWSAQGDALVAENGFVHFGIDSPAEDNTAPASAATLGDTTLSFPADWPNWGDGRFKGWWSQFPIGITAWDVDGGFAYT